MLVAFTTVRRGAPVERSGEIVVMDWERRVVLAERPIGPSGITHDPNPRGNTRGGRGIEAHDDRLIVASFNALHLLDRSLRSVEVVHHPLLIGVHEICTADDGVWVSSTSIDAAIRVNLDTKDVAEVLCPRNLPRVQERFGVDPLELDPARTDLSRFIQADTAHDPSHLHLNALCPTRRGLLGLFNRFGAVVDLRSGQVVVEHPRLRGGHNLVAIGDEAIMVNDTLGRAVCSFALDTATLVGATDLAHHPWAQRVARLHDWRYRLRTILRRVGLPTPPYRALFVRGLEPVPGTSGREVLVGVSPASLVRIDLSRSQVCDVWQFSGDVRCCIHGIRVIEP